MEDFAYATKTPWETYGIDKQDPAVEVLETIEVNSSLWLAQSIRNDLVEWTHPVLVLLPSLQCPTVQAEGIFNLETPLRVEIGKDKNDLPGLVRRVPTPVLPALVDAKPRVGETLVLDIHKANDAELKALFLRWESGSTRHHSAWVLDDQLLADRPNTNLSHIIILPSATKEDIAALFRATMQHWDGTPVE